MMGNSLFTTKAKPKIYSLKAVDDFIQRYYENGGSMAELVPGSLGYGLTILYSPEGNLKTFIIRELGLSPWSSRHTVRGYNKMPEKYRTMLEKMELI